MTDLVERLKATDEFDLDNPWSFVDLRDAYTSLREDTIKAADEITRLQSALTAAEAQMERQNLERHLQNAPEKQRRPRTRASGQQPVWSWCMTTPPLAVKEGWTPIPTRALQWLFGEMQGFDDKWFGESGRDRKGAYWWRTEFRRQIELAGTFPNTGGPTEEELAKLRAEVERLQKREAGRK